jgi:hypothetical protein
MDVVMVAGKALFNLKKKSHFLKLAKERDYKYLGIIPSFKRYHHSNSLEYVNVTLKDKGDLHPEATVPQRKSILHDLIALYEVCLLPVCT